MIVDSSITATWLFEDERTSDSEAIQERLVDESALVPHHWPLEMTNVIAMAERKRRISHADSEQFLSLLAELVIDVAPAGDFAEIVALLPLCRKHRLTSYDAAYLALAISTGLPLATLDRDLRHAAIAVGVPLI
jgi:predicted nucleic acid-binding protein